MIGVDLVDLTDPLLKPRTSREIQLIAHPRDACPFSNDANLLYWLFWSAKEAIFKAHRLKENFLPQAIEVIYDSSEKNKLHYRGKWLNELEGYTLVSNVEVTSVAAFQNLEKIEFRKYHLNSNDPSLELRAQFHNEMGSVYQISVDGKGLPLMLINESILPASISHHHESGIVGWAAI